MTDWVKKKLTREDIYHVQEEAVKACREYGLGCVPVFDEKILLNTDISAIKQLEEAIKSYEKKWQENSELSCICDMALRYLDIVEERKEIGCKELNKQCLECPLVKETENVNSNCYN